MNMQVLKRSRREPEEGDLFVYKIRGLPYGFGRVIRKGTKIGGFTDVILLYFYDAFSEKKDKVPKLDRRKLLVPPLGTNRRPWTMGYFQTVRSEPLKDSDTLPVHCFRCEVREAYLDEYGRRLPRKRSPCGLYALGSFRTIDAKISMALGIEPSPDTVPP